MDCIYRAADQQYPKQILLPENAQILSCNMIPSVIYGIEDIGFGFLGLGGILYYIIVSAGSRK